MVTKGFQTANYNETYSLVGNLLTFRTLISIANRENLEIEHMDVKTAFLHGKLSEEIFINLPEELKKTDVVCKLNKSMYGLKQAPRRWNEEFHLLMIELGFVNSHHDTCLYVTNECGKSIVFLFVDDLLIVGKEKGINKFKEKILNRFDMTDLGEVKFFLDFSICRNRENGTIIIHRKQYSQLILEKFGMINCKGVKTPIEKF